MGSENQQNILGAGDRMTENYISLHDTEKFVQLLMQKWQKGWEKLKGECGGRRTDTWDRTGAWQLLLQ